MGLQANNGQAWPVHSGLAGASIVTTHREMAWEAHKGKCARCRVRASRRCPVWQREKGKLLPPHLYPLSLAKMHGRRREAVFPP